jgi:hypothetical protein
MEENQTSLLRADRATGICIEFFGFLCGLLLVFVVIKWVKVSA